METIWLAGMALAFVISLATTPAGVSGAVLLLPAQVSLLGVPSPSVTPTNLLYNVIATPGALAGFARDGRLITPLTKLLVLGTLPGVIVGAFIRVELLSGPRAFLFVISLVLLPLGLWLLAGRPAGVEREPTISSRGIVALSLGVGVIGGIYGIGGGSFLAPILVILGYSLREVAPAAIASTFAASVVGVGAYQLLELGYGGTIAPDYVLGLFLGIGGLAGGYAGARLQRRIPELALRRMLGAIACAIAFRYLVDVAEARAEAPVLSYPTLAPALPR